MPLKQDQFNGSFLFVVSLFMTFCKEDIYIFIRTMGLEMDIWTKKSVYVEQLVCQNNNL